MNTVKELIKESAELIDIGWDLLGNTNMSHGPVILVYVGETVYDNREYLLKTLKNNWKNGSYIEEILVPIDYDGTDAVLLENTEQDTNTGEVIGAVEHVIDVCIRDRLLKTMDGVFANKRRIFIECIMAGEDICDIDIIEELIKPVQTLRGLELWKSFYMMIDQSNAENEDKARFMIESLNKSKEKFFSDDGFRQIYVLSNYLSDGTIIGENRMPENYRAISDILLLKNNYNISEGKRNSQFELLNQRGSVRTISYKLVEKPCREIAIATYMGLISEMVNVPVDEELHRAFNTSEFTFFEDYFLQNIESQMPGANALSYLAWLPGEEERLKNAVVTMETLDRATMNQWSVFFKMYYDSILETETDSTDFKMKFHHYLKGKFNYKEMRECFNKEEAESVVERGEMSLAAGGKSSLLVRAALCGKNYARKLYYNGHVMPIYKNTLEHLYKKSSDFSVMIQQINNTLPRALMIINSNLYSSIDEYYDRIVKSYIFEHREDFNRLMDVDYTEEEFLNALYNFFKTMVKHLEIYSMNFEGEMTERLEGFGGDHARRNKIIENALSDNIEGSKRLSMAMGANSREIYQTYLGNPRANFVKRLMDDNNSNVYDLEKSDCIENLVIYEIDSLSDIFGGAV